MIISRNSMNQMWLDLNCPTKEELDSMILTQSIDPLVAKDLLTPTPKQYAKEFDGSIYLVMHLPYLKNSKLKIIPPTVLEIGGVAFRADPCYPGLLEAMIDKIDLLVISTHC